MKQQRDDTREGVRRFRLFFLFRLVAITVLVGLDIIFRTGEGESLTSPHLMTLYFFILFAYFFTIASSLVLPWLVDSLFFVFLQFIWEVIFTAILVALTGGIESLFVLLYFLAILNAAAHSGRRGGIAIALLCSLSYGAILWVQYHEGVLPFLGTLSEPGSHLPASGYIYNFFRHFFAFALVAGLGGYLAEELRRKREDLRRQESSLQRLRRLHRQIVENMSTALMTIDLEGRIVDWNRAASEITGLARQKIRGKEYHSFLPEFERYIEPVRRGEVRFQRRCEATMSLPRGERHIGFSVSPLHIDTEGVRGYVIAFQDLTELKRMEEEVRRRERLAAVGELAASIAHEIRNPLTAMSGSIQVLQHGLQVKDEHARLMDIILRESDRLNRLITDFLSYARSSDRKEERFDLASVTRETLEMFRSGLQEGEGAIQVESKCPDSLIMKGDEQQMRQILWNLLMNAKQAMPKGGQLSVEIKDGFEQPESFVEISIKDSGKGIPKDILPKVFDPFFTTKEEGTGLGLAVVYRVVESHRGKIDVQSEEGRGTSFVIRIPRAENPVS